MRENNKFIIISTVYNKGKWVQFNINSVKQQSYRNYLAVYGYDLSIDNTYEYLTKSIDGDENFIIYDNPNPGSFLNCFMGTYKFLKEKSLVKPDDIIVEIDGDDWLLHPFVLEYLNSVYQDSNIWMTYGQYIQYPSGQVGGHYYLELNDEVDKRNEYRKYEFPYSHLKTYKAFLLDNITDEDLIDVHTGNYFNAAADFALCMPLVEQAGKSRIHRVSEPIYVYNVSTDLESETNNRLQLQKEIEQRIRKIKPKNRL
jgi:glycosyltransferase involved in cell wall biosynthesis